MRVPGFVLEKEQQQLLVGRLIPIVDWEDVRKGEEIYHESSNTIYDYDLFIRKDGDIIIYANINKGEYSLYATGWYYYDQYEVDVIEENFTPKLYNYKGKMHMAYNLENLEETIGKSINIKDVERVQFVDGYTVQLV